MLKVIRLFAFVFCACCGFGLAAEKMVVIVAVSSVWSSPEVAIDQEAARPPCLHDDVSGLLTQLLYGEYVLCEESNHLGWRKVLAVEQVAYNFDCECDEFVSGWIREDHVRRVDVFFVHDVVVADFCALLTGEVLLHTVPLGATFSFLGEDDRDSITVLLHDASRGRLPRIAMRYADKDIEPVDTLRNKIACGALMFAMQSYPYCWGGRSAYATDASYVSGVDCSGLVNLLFRSCGLTVPRNSQTQWMHAAPVAPKDLRPGDLLFLKSTARQRVHHVLIFIGAAADGDAVFVESTGRADIQKIRVIGAQERFGVALRDCENGVACGDDELWCGSFLNTPEMIKDLRRKFLCGCAA